MPKSRRDRGPCTIEGCEKIDFARGWCSRHYTIWKRHGDPTHRLRGEVRDGKRICPRCKVDTAVDDFYPGNAYCKSCSSEMARAYPRPVMPKPPTIHCVQCGARFAPRARTQICCSPQCGAARTIALEVYTRDRDRAAELNRQYRRRSPEKHVARQQKRRAQKLGAFVEDVDHLVVMERGGWTCALCGKPIEPDRSHPDPMSKSVDHIVPLSRGGEHSYSNCQPAHLFCNQSKGARVAA